MRSLILDLDYTILDTVAFEQALARSLNLSWSQWQQAYTAYMRDQVIFEPQAFLRGRTTLERKQFLTICDATWKYLYPDVRPFLRQAQAKDYTITVLTYGQKAWQRRKGEGLKLTTVKIVTTDQSKVKSVQRYATTETVIVDDRGSILDEIKQRYPQLDAYWIKRPNAKYRTEKPTVAVKNITSLKQIIL